MKTITDTQKEFEKKVANILGFTDLMQRDFSEQMIIESFSGENDLSGTIGLKRNKNNCFDVLLIATKDSEVNHIESITLKMIDLMISEYVSFKEGKRCLRNYNNKVILATNLPIEIHSSRASDIKEQYNFHIKNIGYSFCEKYNLEFTQMY